MKVSEMDKATLKAHMIGNGSIHRIDGSTAEWKRAFELAKADGLGVDPDCPKCWVRISDWMNKEE